MVTYRSYSDPTGDKRKRSERVRDSKLNVYRQKRWRTLRRLVLDQEPFCADPFGKHKDLPALATEVHHLIEARVRPDLFYERSNLQPLCKSCHSRCPPYQKKCVEQK